MVQQIDRRVKGILRGVDVESLSRTDQATVRKLRLACNEVKLDVRDYEYAQTRSEQEKWIRHAQHNIQAFETLLLMLGDIFGPADIAELSAQLAMLKEAVT